MFDKIMYLSKVKNKYSIDSTSDDDLPSNLWLYLLNLFLTTKINTILKYF